MELSQQPKPFGIEGRKKTHDFLSLYTAAHQDQRSTQGGFLQTHDFLQPLEQVRKNGISEEDIKDARKSPPQMATVASAPPLAQPSSLVEHILPGGIGSYSITTNFNQRIPMSNTGNVFTLWHESAAVNKGKTGKENNASNKGEAGINEGGGQWTMPMDNPTSTHNQNNTTFSSSQPCSANRNQTLMDMITCTKNNNHEEDDEEEEEECIIKNEPSSYSRDSMIYLVYMCYTALLCIMHIQLMEIYIAGILSVKVDGNNAGQKPNTPRSKHSATEQRRRNKINDRFQKLREIIPHGDQKRDKASFLLEVIEYIQYLQEKVHKYDATTYQGWNHEPPKILPRIIHRNVGGFTNQNQPTNSGSCPTVLLSSKYDETKDDKCASLPFNGHPLVELDISNANNLSDKIYRTEPITKVEPTAQQPRSNNIFAVGSGITPQTTTQECDVNKIDCQYKPQNWSSSSSAITEKVKNHELCIESGEISISSRYSQGLLNNLTQALQSSGVDLSQASISVQIDLGKRANADSNTSAFIIKDDEIHSKNQTMPTASLIKNKTDEYVQVVKRLKTSTS